MPYPIETKLVVGVSSTALFDLRVEDEVFRNHGIEAYRQYQEEHRGESLKKGVAYPFIKRLLHINKVYSNEVPIEVVLLSKNSPEVGLRIFDAIQEHELNITRAAFTSGRSPYEYIPSYNIALFLSTNDVDVSKAIEAGYAAGKFINAEVADDDDSAGLRVAFDFDGVIAGDSSERVYKATGIDLFHQHEVEHVEEPLEAGPLADFFRRLSKFQALETEKENLDPKYHKMIRTAIVTARNAPSHERAIRTLKDWGVTVDDMFLLGGIEKSRILNVLKPHIYFDDQLAHLNTDLTKIPLVHIPFGIANASKR